MVRIHHGPPYGRERGIQMSKLQLRVLVLLLSLTPSFAMADVSLGDAAGILTSLGDVLSKVMWAACIIVGVALIAAGFTQFQIHRRNPKLVPLATPVLYLILGICAIAIPFIDRITDFVGDNKKKIERSPAGSKDDGSNNPRNVNESHSVNDIDAPIN